MYSLQYSASDTEWSYGPGANFWYVRYPRWPRGVPRLMPILA